MPKHYTVTWNPADCNIIPTIPGQSETLADGSLRAWYTAEQLEATTDIATRLKEALAEDELLPAPE